MLLDLDAIFSPDQHRLRSTRARHARQSKVIQSPEDLRDDWLELWEERAAIMEFDSGLTREDAERFASRDIRKQMSTGKLN